VAEGRNDLQSEQVQNGQKFVGDKRRRLGVDIGQRRGFSDLETR
jgi:hypothetical protein